MRLLEYTGSTVKLTEDLVHDIPEYAILSHTWGSDAEEVTFKDLVEGTGRDKAGYKKIEFCAEQAKRDGLRYFWLDTCCIDKSNNCELSTAINSMFLWYRDSHRCYVYLSGISAASHGNGQGSEPAWKPALRSHRWFTRGWTLQELLAPRSVEFFTPDHQRLGDKRSLERLIHQITGIAIPALRGRDLSKFGTRERYRWARARQTTHEEDWAYCLLGLFGVSMPIIYGEGRENAVRRLNEGITSKENIVPASNQTWFIVPYPRNSKFVGREAIVKKLQHQALQGRVSLFGLGGIGKTEIALEYAYWIYETCADVSVFWVHASTAEQFRESYTSIARICQIAGRDDPETDVLQLVKRWLEAKYQGWWLMVIDDADDAQLFGQTEGLQHYIPECAHGSIVVTTRNMQTGLMLANGKPPIEVSAMTDGESEQLLRANIGEVDVASDKLSALCSSLENLPLALVQAATFINMNVITISEYLQLLDHTDQNLVDLLSEEFESSKTPRALAEAWAISFREIQQQNALAGDLLSLMSFFDCKAIAPEFLANYGQQNGHEGDSIQLTKALGVLKAFSLITIAKDDTLSMHRLVQLVTRKWLALENRLRYFAGQALLALSHAYPYGSYENRAVCRAYLPHVYSVLEFEGTGSSDEVTARATLLHCTAAYFYNKGLLKESERLQLEMVQLQKELLGEEDPDTLSSIAKLASTYRGQGRWKEAESLEIQVIETLQRVLGADHPDTLRSMANLASTYQGQGRWKEAESLEVQVMEAFQRVLGAEHPNTLRSMANLALTYQGQGRWKEAERLEVQVMEAFQRVLGAEHPDTLRSMANLALTYQSQGRWGEAEAMYERALRVCEKTFGTEHPSTLSAKDALRNLYFSRGRLIDAEVMNERALWGFGGPSDETFATQAKTTFGTHAAVSIPRPYPLKVVLEGINPVNDTAAVYEFNGSHKTWTTQQNVGWFRDLLYDARRAPWDPNDLHITDSAYASGPAVSYQDKQAMQPQVGIPEEFERESGLLVHTGIPSRIQSKLKDQYVSQIALELTAIMARGDLDNSAVQILERSLPDMLKAFALMIGHGPQSATHHPQSATRLEIMYFVHRYSREIADQIQMNLTEIGEEQSHGKFVNEPSTMARAEVSSWLLGLSETPVDSNFNTAVNKAAVNSTDKEPDEKSDGESHQESDEEEDENPEQLEPDTTQMEKHRDCLIHSSAFEWLKGALSANTSLIPAVPDTRSEIRNQILQTLRSKQKPSRKRGADSHQIVLELDWDPRSFVEEQGYVEEPADAIQAAVTLTGSDRDANALTTSQYLSQTWPLFGAYVMRIVQRVLQGERGERHSVTLPDHTTLTAWSTGSKFTVEALGPLPSVAEIAEQFSWLGAALRSSPHDQGASYCTPYIGKISPGELGTSSAQKLGIMRQSIFHINFSFEEVQFPASSSQCWHGMFRNPVIVRGYPILRRKAAHTKTGLEMPLNMMARMVRTAYVVPFGNTWYLKGFSSMLAVTERRDGILFWHHFYNPAGNRISYFEHTPISPVEITASELENSRHIVGWCPNVKLYAGSKDDVNYSISESGLDFTHSTCVLDRVSISGGKFVSGGVSAAIGIKETPIHISRNTYFDKMDWLSRQYVILWDQGDERGWLVNGTSALLHIVRASLEYQLSGKLGSHILFHKDKLHGATASHTPDAALEVLMNPSNRELQIFLDKADVWTETVTSANGETKTEEKRKETYSRFEDRVEKKYVSLEQILDHQIRVETRPGVNLKPRIRKFLEGWEFGDLAVETDYIRPRVKTLKTVAKGWVDFTREIKAITLFGRGFGDIIRPTDATSMCDSWARVPLHSNYLAVCLSDLKDIMRLRASERLEVPREICNGVNWHPGDNIFGKCRCNVTEHAAEHSDFVQVLAPPRWTFKTPAKRSTTLDFGLTGAVIFGHSSVYKLVWRDEGDPVVGGASDEALHEVSDATENELDDSGLGQTPTTPGTSVTIEAASTTPGTSVTIEATSTERRVAAIIPLSEAPTSEAGPSRPREPSRKSRLPGFSQVRRPRWRI